MSPETYTPDQLRKIMNAYVRDDRDDPALKAWRDAHEDVLPEDDESGFLTAALEALGEGAYRRELLPFVAELDAFADDVSRRDDYPHGVDALRAAIHEFKDWCEASEFDEGQFRRARTLIDFMWSRDGKLLCGVDYDDQFWACLEPLRGVADDDGGGGIIKVDGIAKDNGGGVILHA